MQSVLRVDNNFRMKSHLTEVFGMIVIIIIIIIIIIIYSHLQLPTI